MGEQNERERATSSALAEMYRANWGIATKAMSDLLGLKEVADRRRVGDAQRRAAETEAIVGELLASQQSILNEAGRIPHETLIIHSREDRAAPFRHGRDLASVIKNSRLIPIAGDHDFTSGDSADAVPSAILDFLGEDANTELGTSAHDLEASKRDRVQLAAAGQTSGRLADGYTISPRQHDVLERIALGEANREIGAALGIAEGTVKRHVSDLLHKTGLKNRRQLMRFADGQDKLN